MKQTCPICGNNSLMEYDQSQFAQYIPTSIPNTVICESCGYYTCDTFTTKYNHKSAKIVMDLKIIDEQLDRIWYPIILDLYKIGAIYPIGTSIEDYGWALTPYVAIPMPQRILFPINKEKNLYQEYMLNHEKTQSFEKSEFNLALTHFMNLIKKFD